MSLKCNECESYICFSESLPGKEGTFVHPNLLSLIYASIEKEDLVHKIVYLQAQENRSLCFECLEKKLPKENKEKFLKPIYDSYEAETVFKKIEEDLEGKWMDFSDIEKYNDAFKAFDRKYKLITSDCIFCQNDVKNGKPFFTAKVIDRVYSNKYKTIMTGAYSWSNCEKGLTNFQICYDDFRTNFPVTFKSVSYDLQKQPSLDKKIGADIYISGEDKNGFVDNLVENLLEKGTLENIRIIKREKEN